MKLFSEKHLQLLEMMIRGKIDFLIIGDLEFPFISLPHLVISKISSQRLRDQADVEELQKISKLKI